MVVNTMIEVNLNVRDYNELFCSCMGGANFCKRDNDSITLTSSPNSKYVITTIKLNTPEGEILSHYTDCLIKGDIDKGSISLYNTCSGRYYACKNCSFDPYEDGCEKGLAEILENLDNKIEDIVFIDPIQGRDKKTVDIFETWGKKLLYMKEDLSENYAPEIQTIYALTELLHNQLNTLIAKWSYEEEDI